MSNYDDEWSRKSAEEKITSVFDAAKTGHVQKIQDFDGTFELRFVKAKGGLSAAQILAKGSPLGKASR